MTFYELLVQMQNLFKEHNYDLEFSVNEYTGSLILQSRCHRVVCNAGQVNYELHQYGTHRLLHEKLKELLNEINNH